MDDLIELHRRHLQAAGMSPHTIDDRTKLLVRLDRELPNGLPATSAQEIEGWLSHQGWAPETRRTYYHHVVGFFRWAVAGRTPHLDWDPTVELTRPRAHRGLPRPITDEQLRFLLVRARGVWAVGVRLAAYAGMRCSEMAAAERAHVTEADVRILGKGGKVRVVPTHPEVWAAVAPLRGRLITAADGRSVDGDWVTRYFSRHLDIIGTPDITAHRLRHWFGTNVQRMYRDLRVTQELLGHASPATTAVYTMVTSDQRRLAVATLPSFASTPEPADNRLGGLTAA